MNINITGYGPIALFTVVTGFAGYGFITFITHFFH